MWFTQLGFDENPLSSKPNPALVGLQEEEDNLINFILKEEICFLNGPTGSGKTSLLQKVQNNLQNHILIYLNAEDLPENFNLEKEMRGKRSFFDKITLREFPSKKPILLIDEFQDTDPNLVLEAKGKWENPGNKKIKSIVIAQISRQLRNASGSFRERLGKKIINLRTLEHGELKEILKKRLHNSKSKTNYYDKLGDETVEFIIKCSGSNVRRLLEFTDLLFDFHYRKFGDKNPILSGNYVVSYYAARDILEANSVFPSERKAAKPVMPATKAKKIKMFSKDEKMALRAMLDLDVATTGDIALEIGVPLYKARGLLGSLAKKGAISVAEIKGRAFPRARKPKKLWEVSHEARRLLVKK